MMLVRFINRRAALSDQKASFNVFEGVLSDWNWFRYDFVEAEKRHQYAIVGIGDGSVAEPAEATGG
jgi:hypothetical protein